jgi:hypothetical protein
MSIDQKALETLIAKDEIRDLVLLYSRGCDRKDFALVRTLYTSDATDSHDETFDGPAKDYVDFLARSLPHAPYSGHHICNHLISVDVDRGEAEGEVYAVAWHVIPDRKGGWIEDFMCCRYVDRYCKDRRGHPRRRRAALLSGGEGGGPSVTNRSLDAAIRALNRPPHRSEFVYGKYRYAHGADG